MRIRVYHDGDLVAAFEYGRQPSYYGALGRRVRALVERPHPVRNLWTGETAARPVDGCSLWWASAIFIAGLREAGLTVRVELAIAMAGALRPAGEREAGRAASALAVS